MAEEEAAPEVAVTEEVGTMNGAPDQDDSAQVVAETNAQDTPTEDAEDSDAAELKIKSLEADKSSLTNTLVALRMEFDEFKKDSQQEHQHLIEEKERAYSSLKELLVNQAQEVDRFHSKVSDMQTQMVDASSNNSSGDVQVRLKLVENALFDLREKYDERVKHLEQEKDKMVEEKEALVAGIREALSSSNGSTKGRIDPQDLQSEIATLARLRDLVASLDAQLQAATTGDGEQQLEATMLLEKLALVEKEHAATEKDLRSRRARLEEHLTSIVHEKNRMLNVKENLYSSVKEMAGLQAQEAQAARARLASLKATMDDDQASDRGFDEMEVRLKLAESALEQELISKQTILQAEREHYNAELVALADIVPAEAIAKAKDPSSSATPLFAGGTPMDFGTTFDKIKRQRQVLEILEAQIGGAASSTTTTNGHHATTNGHSNGGSSAPSNGTVQQHNLEVEQAMVQGRLQRLEAKETACVCMKEALQMHKREAALLRSKLAAWKQARGGGEQEEDAGMEEMETRLKLVDAALLQIEENTADTAKEVASDKNLLILQQAASSSGATTTALTDDSSSELMDLKDCCAKLQVLGQIVASLKSQVEGASNGATASHEPPMRAGPNTHKELEQMRQDLLAEKATTCAWLKQAVGVQEQQVQRARTKLDAMKETSSAGVDEMETRVKLVEVALANIRTSCEDCTDSDSGPTDTKAILAKLDNLKGIVRFLHAQLDAATEPQDMEEEKPKEIVVNNSHHPAAMKERSLFLSDDSSSTEEDFVKEKEKRRTIALAAVGGCAVVCLFYLVFVWDSNKLCAPVAPKSRLAEGIYKAPYWVPGSYKDAVYRNVCSRVPRIQLEVTGEELIVKQMPDPANPPPPQETNRRRGRNNPNPSDDLVQTYPAKHAYTTANAVFAKDADGVYRGVSMPWAKNYKRD